MTDELLVPRGVALDDAAAALLARLTVRERGARTRDIVFLDTFDARARAAGMSVTHEAGRLGVSPGASVALRRPARPFGTDALPAGPVRETLAPVIGVRALRPLARVFARERRFAVLDEEGKTVARVDLLAPALSEADGSLVLLRGRVRLEGLRGYGRELDGVRARLVDELGCVPAEEPLHDAAVRAAGGNPAGFTGGLGSVALAPGEPAGTAVAAVLGALWHVVESNVDGVIEDADVEHLHDLRVAVRRARSVLRELPGVVPADALGPLREELRWLQAATGQLRDLDIALLDFDELTGLVRTPGLAGALEPLRGVLAQRRRRAFTTLRRVLRSRRFVELGAASRVAMDGPDAGEPIDALAGARIHSRYRRMVRMGRAIQDSSPAEALHDLRKQGKELRYLLELFGGLFEPTTVRPLVRTLKSLQDTLGRHQDRSVQAALVGALAAEIGSPDPATLLAAGALIERLHEDERVARQEFAARFPGFAARDVRRRVRESFV